MSAGLGDAVRAPERGRARLASKASLTVGFLALCVAIWLAWNAPATTYELSIYANTPLGSWIGIGVALAVALVVAMAFDGALRATALGLGGSTMTFGVTLPLVRNYRFQDPGDPLTHLGWTREIFVGQMDPIELFYPALHTMAIQFSVLTGIRPERGLLLAPVVLYVVFLVSVPLVVRTVTDDGRTVALAAITAWVALPVDHIGVLRTPYPTTLALFFFPAFLYAFLTYLDRPVDRTLPFGVTPYGVLLSLYGFAILLFHPQQMVNALIVLGVAVALQHVARWRSIGRVIAGHRSLDAHTAFLAGVFVLWTVSRETFQDTLLSTVKNALVSTVGTTSSVSQRGSSLSEVGGSIGEMFFKLYFVSSVYVLLTMAVATLVLLYWLDRVPPRSLPFNWSTRFDRFDESLRLRYDGGFDVSSVDWLDRPTESAAITYLAAPLIPLAALFVAYFVGTPTLGFRQLGFLLVFGSILGPLGFASLDRSLSDRVSPHAGRSILSVVLAVFLVLSVFTLFPSPYMYEGSNHVTDEQFTGHEFAIEHQGEGMEYSRLELGTPMYRFDNALYGVGGSQAVNHYWTADDAISPEAFNEGDLASAYDEPRYFKLETSDYLYNVEMYDEFRYEREGFERIDRQSDVDKVSTNGEVRWYVIHGENDAETESEN